MPVDDTNKLVRLSDLDEEIAARDADVRGRDVKDKNGEDLGKVEDLLVDEQESKVRFLVIASGGFLGIGKDKAFLPVDAITQILDDEVRVDQTREHVSGAPPYDPELVYEQPYFDEVYGYYGYVPYWGSGYTYPIYPPLR